VSRGRVPRAQSASQGVQRGPAPLAWMGGPAGTSYRGAGRPSYDVAAGRSIRSISSRAAGEDAAHRVNFLRISVRRRPERRAHQAHPGAQHLHRGRAHRLAPVVPGRRPAPHPICRILLLRELGEAGVGDREDALAVLLPIRLDQPLVLQQLQVRVDAARAGLVHAAGASLQLLHQLVAVLRAILQQRQQSDPHFARLEEAAPESPGSAASMLARRAKEPAEAAAPAGPVKHFAPSLSVRRPSAPRGGSCSAAHAVVASPRPRRPRRRSTPVARFSYKYLLTFYR
jgi:hypothetical protein